MRLGLTAASLLAASLQPPPHHRMCEGQDVRELLSTLPKGARSRVVFKAGDEHMPLTKVKGESMEHLLMKALLWALMVPSTDGSVECELDVGHRYKPGAAAPPQPPSPARALSCEGGAPWRRVADVVALSSGQPCWWGECGSVTTEKLADLREAFPAMRLTIAKWGHSDLSGYAAQLGRALPAARADAAPIDLVSFPVDSVERFVAEDGSLSVRWDLVDTQQVQCKVRRR